MFQENSPQSSPWGHLCNKYNSDRLKDIAINGTLSEGGVKWCQIYNLSYSLITLAKWF